MTNEGTDHRKRALILAGGGLKVAAQAGVLQVWLDEAGKKFDHADGASGGVFNLAMLCQGMSGKQIADNWRIYSPLRAASPNIRGILAGPFGSSLLTNKGLRNVFRTRWGLDWPAIQQYQGEATFNVYNFTKQRLEIIEPAQMTEDMLIAAVSLPIWFPAVRSGGHDYIDAVFGTDANIEEALRRGADEIWIIWTVSRAGRWRRGWINEYFQIIEACANSRLQLALDSIEENNRDITKGQWRRRIEIKKLEMEVPLHYLVNFRGRKFTKAVDLGVREARAWCRENDVPLSGPETSTSSKAIGIRFTEVMKGEVHFGLSDPRERPAAPVDWQPMRLELQVQIADLHAFRESPHHVATLSGSVVCEAFGGARPVVNGTVRLLVPHPGGTRTMEYRLTFRNGSGQAFCLLGIKYLRDDKGFDLWPDTTTLLTTVTTLTGTGSPHDRQVAAGALYITPLALLRMLPSFRPEAPDSIGAIRAFNNFFGFFFGALRSVYGGSSPAGELQEAISPD